MHTQVRLQVNVICLVIWTSNRLFQRSRSHTHSAVLSVVAVIDLVSQSSTAALLCSLQTPVTQLFVAAPPALKLMADAPPGVHPHLNAMVPVSISDRVTSVSEIMQGSAPLLMRCVQMCWAQRHLRAAQQPVLRDSVLTVIPLRLLTTSF